jgi:hypothetical protein
MSLGTGTDRLIVVAGKNAAWVTSGSRRVAATWALVTFAMLTVTVRSGLWRFRRGIWYARVELVAIASPSTAIAAAAAATTNATTVGTIRLAAPAVAALSSGPPVTAAPDWPTTTTPPPTRQAGGRPSPWSGTAAYAGRLAVS